MNHKAVLRFFSAAILVCCGNCVISFAAPSPTSLEDAPGARYYKRGGLPPEAQWKKDDVLRYLSISFLLNATNDSWSITTAHLSLSITNRQSLCGLAIAKDLFSNTASHERQSFMLNDGKSDVFRIVIYGADCWKDACGDLYSHVTDTVEMWSLIPKYYVVRKEPPRCLVLGTGNRPRLWHFNTKDGFVSYVSATDGVDSELKREEMIRKMNDIVNEIDVLTNRR